MSQTGTEREYGSCGGITHVFSGNFIGGPPWCNCGKVRNMFYKRSLLDKILGRPKSPNP